MKVFVSILLFFVPLILTAQNYLWDVGGGIGSSYYLGDIGGKQDVSNPGITDLQPEATRFGLEGFVRGRMSYRWAAKFKVGYSLISGDDKFSSGTSRELRNLSFRNSIFEASSRLEFYPLIINDLGGKKRFTNDLFFSLHLGFGMMYHNPQAKYNGKWHNLRPLQTEGSNSNYSRVQPVIPMGFGLFTSFKGKKSQFRRNRIGVELDFRLTFTDYLDDVSTSYVDPSEFGDDDLARDLYYRGWELNGQDDPETRRYPPTGYIRGNPDNNDAYFTIMFSYSYIIASGKRKFNRPRYGYQFGNNKGRSRKARF